MACLVLAVFLPTFFTAHAQEAGGYRQDSSGIPASTPPAPVSVNINAPATNDCEWYNLFCHIQQAIYSLTGAIMTIFLFIAGIVITLAMTLITTMIDMSGSLLSLPLVQSGFQVTLALTNLGFVLAIIVIAFATILRLEKYALKQLLWKLIAAAVLVNFSLAIAGFILDFTNVLSHFFIAHATPGGNGDFSFAKIADFATQMASSLNIQKLTNIKSIADLKLAGNPLAEVGASAFDFSIGLITNLLSLFLSLVFSIIIAIVIFGIGLMLLIRWVWIVVLLIFMPLAWLFWIIPDLKKYWGQWWSKFLQWTFFLPAVTFFLYLAMLSSTGTDAIVKKSVTTVNNPATSAADKYIIQNDGVLGFLQVLIKIGLFTGALLAGNALGITGAKVALSGATGVKNWAVGKVSSRAQRLGTFPFRSKAGRTTAEGIQKFGAGLEGKGKHWYTKPFFALGHLATRPVRGLGVSATQLAGVGQGEQLVKEAEARQKGTSDEQLAREVTDMQAHERIAALTRLAKNGTLDKVPRLAQYIEDGNTKREFESYGKGREYGDIEKNFGADTEMIKTARKKDMPALKNAAMAFHDKFTLKDYDKLQKDIVKKFDSKKPYGGLSENTFADLQNATIRAIGEKNPGAFARLMPKLSGKDFENFKVLILKESVPENMTIEIPTPEMFPGGPTIIREYVKSSEATEEQLLIWLKANNKKIYESLTKNMSNRMTGATFEEIGGTPPASVA